MSDNFLIFKCINAYNMRFHNIDNLIVLISHKQILYSDYTDKFSVLGHITSINSFLIHTDFTNFFKSFRYRHILMQTDIFYCHYTSGTVLRITQNFINRLTLARCRVFQNSRNNIRRHFFNYINSIINKRFIKNISDFFVGKHLYKMALHIAVHMCKCFSRQILWQKSEQNHKFSFFTEHFTEQFIKQHRKVCGILIFHNIFYFKKFFFFQKTVYFIQQILHWGTPYLIWNFPILIFILLKNFQDVCHCNQMRKE